MGKKGEEALMDIILVLLLMLLVLAIFGGAYGVSNFLWLVVLVLFVLVLARLFSGRRL